MERIAEELLEVAKEFANAGEDEKMAKIMLREFKSLEGRLKAAIKATKKLSVGKEADMRHIAGLVYELKDGVHNSKATKYFFG